MDQQLWQRRFSRANGYGEVFTLVQDSVEETLGRRRAGLALALEELPGSVGAYHAMGSNFLVLNKRVLDAFDAMGKPREERQALLYSLLLHEYLHSLGLPDEATVRQLVYRVSSECFGANHPATRLAQGGPWAQHPELSNLPAGRQAFIVPGLDEETRRYIG